MSKEKRRVPKLRFPGFTEDWEQYRFNNLLKINLERNDGKFNSNKTISIARMKYNKLGNGASDESLNNYKVLRFGDVAFEGHENKEFKFGRFVMNDIGDGIMSPRFTALRPIKVLEVEFWKEYINYEPIMQKKLVNSTKKGTMMHELVVDEFLKQEILLPSKEEQQKIGGLLKLQSNIINLHQRKVEHLILKKKALLQKLFPRNRNRYPDFRFPGFTDAWEQRKLTDIAKTFIGLVTTMTENYRDSGTLLIRNSDIKEGQFIFSEKPIHLDEEFAEKNKTRRLQIGDVVTVHTGDIGTSAVIQEKEAGAIGFATINTRTDKRILNPYFLSTYFNTDKHKCYANSVSTGDGRSNYNIKDFNKLVISIPTLDEQEKISVLINNINTIITLHQRKLDHLKLQKKALLQQMFV